MEARVLGTAIHALLERVSRLPGARTPDDVARCLELGLPGVVAEMRGRGFSLAATQRLGAAAVTAAREAAAEPVGAWILAGHAQAETEARWTGQVSMGSGRERPWNLRPDRVFFAAAPEALRKGRLIPDLPDGPVWWIVDYKSSHASDLVDGERRRAFLAAQRERYAGQLGAYGQVLRGLIGGSGPDGQVWAGIYYPRLRMFDCWPV